MKRLILIVLGIALVLNTSVAAQQASQNISVLPVIPESDGDDWYLRGDGYLQRQVEPTIAVSTRNPDHILSFFVDYRAVNVPDDIGLGEETQTLALTMKTTKLMLAGLVSLPEIPLLESPPIAAAEAWVGGSASHDGGMTWSGFFMPGASFDHSVISAESPVYGLQAATDPVAVAGPCGYVYVAFMAFTRGGESKLVVARFQDLNDSESGSTWQYQGTWELESGNNATNGYFLDKPHINLDVFREDSDFAAYSQYYDPEEYECGHRVYTSYSTFNGLDKFGKFQSKLNFAYSNDRGETWDKSRIQQPYTQNQGSFIAVDPRPGTPDGTGGGTVYLVWRHFYAPDAIVMIKTEDYGKKWSKPIELTGDIPMQAFDQPTIQAIDGYSNSPRELAFRSNAFPTAAVTAPNGTVFVAWQEMVDVGPLAEGADSATVLANPAEAYGRPDENGSPRIVMVKSQDSGESWTDVYGNPDSRVAVDIEARDTDPDSYPPPGFGALPTPRSSGPQVKPWLSFGGGELALAYTESRGMYRRVTDENGYPVIPASWYHVPADLSPNGFISDIDRVMDFRVVMLDPSTGIPMPFGSTQVSRYPISFTAVFDDDDVETIDDVAPVVPALCDRINGLPELCQPSLNFVNKNHSGSGHAAFMGDYPGMTPILPMIYDDIGDEGPKQWRWAIDAIDVPYPAFHVVFPDNRHLIPPTYEPGLEEWARYPNYRFYPDPPDPSGLCINPGSRNADVLTAKVNAELVLSAPTTYKQGSPGDPTWGYPISVFNQSGETRFYELTIVEGAGDATFVVDPDELEDPNIDPHRGVVELFAYSSTSQMVYVVPLAEGQVIIMVQQVEWDEVNEEWDPVDGGQMGFVTLNPDPSNPDTNGSEGQNLKIVDEGVKEYIVSSADLDALNPFVRNPFVRNPFVRNPFVRNPFVRNSSINDEVEVIDTTWSIQATADSGAGTYLPVINIDNAEDFLENYAFQLLIYKNAFHGTVDDCGTFNVPSAQIISNVSQSNTDSAENPFVRNPFVRNPFVRNPFVRNPFVRNSAITVAPADGVTAETEGAVETGAKNLIFDEDGTLRVPRVAEKIYITLRAFKLKDPVDDDLEFLPRIDKPAVSFVPTRCTTPQCILYNAPDLVPVGVDADSLEHDTVAAGDWINFPFGGWTLRNQGTTDATPENRPLRHGYYLTTDDSVEFDASGNPTNAVLLHTQTSGDPGEIVIEAGAEIDHPQQNFQIDPDIVADTYNLILYVDDLEEVSEYDEVNNKVIAVVPIIVERPNVPPVAEGQSLSTDEDVVLPITLTANDEENDELTFEIVAGPQYGTLEMTGAEVTYTPEPDFNGADSFTFKAFDGEDYSDITTVNITVASVNDSPVVDPPTINIDEDSGSVAGNINAYDPDGDTLTYTLSDPPDLGTAQIDDGGRFTYTPTPDKNGDDSFTVGVSDGNGGSVEATVHVTIAAINDPPVADNIETDTPEDTEVAISLTATDVENDPLTYSILGSPVNGTLSPVTGQTVTYTPSENFAGTDSFTFAANDGQLDSAPGTVTITITAVNDAPAANATSVMTDEDTSKSFTLTGSDTEGANLSYSIVDAPVHGSITGEPGPGFVYTPVENYNGPDSFTFRVFDGDLYSSAASVSIAVNPVNDAPIAVDGSASTLEDTPVSGVLVASDVDGDTLTYSIVTNGSLGSAIVSGNTFSYTPSPNLFGTDTFTFRVSDGHLNDTGTAAVTIAPVNDGPVANSDEVSTALQNSVLVPITENGGTYWITSDDLTSNDDDIDGDILWVRGVSLVDSEECLTQGMVSWDSDTGAVSYAPPLNFEGTDCFEYSISDRPDDSGISVTGSVTVIVDGQYPDWNFVGFAKPWRPNYKINAGSAIPLKWYYEDLTTGAFVDSSMADPVIRIWGPLENCGDVTSPIAVEIIEDTGSSDLRYSGGEWQFNWDTAGLDAGCYEIRVESQYTLQIDGPLNVTLK